MKGEGRVQVLGRNWRMNEEGGMQVFRQRLEGEWGGEGATCVFAGAEMHRGGGPRAARGTTLRTNIGARRQA